MNCKVGDKVRVKKGLEKKDEYKGVAWLGSVCKEVGNKVLTVKSTEFINYNDFVSFEETGFILHESMLEPVGMKLEDIKVGDKVVPFQKTSASLFDWGDFVKSNAYEILEKHGYLQIETISPLRHVVIEGFVFSPCDLMPYEPKAEPTLQEQLDAKRAEHAKLGAEIARLEAEAKKPKMCRFTMEMELPHHCATSDTEKGKGCKVPTKICPVSYVKLATFDVYSSRHKDCPLEVIE